MPAKRKFAIEDWVMVDAAVLGPSHYVFVAHDEAKLERDAFECQVIEYAGGQWRPLAGNWKWQAVALEVTSIDPLQVHVLGRDGQVGTMSGDRSDETHVEPGRPVGPFRGLRFVLGRLFAFGMKREVFVREDSGAWTRMMAGLEPPPLSKKMTIAEKMKQRLADLGGINALAVDGDGHLTAFGMKGEIWRLENQRWTRIDSPTNLMLQDATEWPDGTIYVCGQSGTLLHGSGNRWQAVAYEGTQKLDFRSICAFNGVLFIADGHSLRVLEKGELKVVDFGIEDTVPSALVVAGPGQLLSVAGQEVWESKDGRGWNSILG